jgi:hypothetical protein
LKPLTPLSAQSAFDPDLINHGLIFGGLVVLHSAAFTPSLLYNVSVRPNPKTSSSNARL